MFCNRCGAQKPDVADFCTSCGAPMPKAVPTPGSGSSVAPGPVPEKGKRTKTIVIAAISAILIIAIIVVAIILINNASGGGGGGSSDRGSSIAQTPEEVVENYLKANFEGDPVWSAKCLGYDYDAYMMDYLQDKDTDFDAVIEYEVEYFEDEDTKEKLADIGMDASEWADKYADVEAEKDYLELDKQYQKEYSKCYNREYEYSCQVKEIEAEELSGEELREAEDSFENWYEAYERWYGELLFEEDQVEAFYEVNVKIEREKMVNPGLKELHMWLLRPKKAVLSSASIEEQTTKIQP